ncbi:hypothetical protein NLX83_08650 [Allokutzneria sp. A3M-2-11 16]|uniref:hypothetical protein n=1 Tax=Allokutzneria sp. A3M-2-11 16 TaxID=2962043 RepID=UPI0020B71B3E|nr:hypothetical protein [Allokutzneria sp. A3M-2-11 16]MCP3799321.1 hypothetical protein [Allokutzneria sp. A3M-2-11 16]
MTRHNWLPARPGHVVVLTGFPRWWMWNPAADLNAVRRLAQRKRIQSVFGNFGRIGAGFGLPAVTVLLVLGMNFSNVLLVALLLGVLIVALAGGYLAVGSIRVRVSGGAHAEVEQLMVGVADEEDVIAWVHFEGYPDDNNLARSLCEPLTSIQRSGIAELDFVDRAALAALERRVWETLVELRDQLVLRSDLGEARGRPAFAGIAAEMQYEVERLNSVVHNLFRGLVTFDIAIRQFECERARDAEVTRTLFQGNEIEAPSRLPERLLAMQDALRRAINS